MLRWDCSVLCSVLCSVSSNAQQPLWSDPHLRTSPICVSPPSVYLFVPFGKLKILFLNVLLISSLCYAKYIIVVSLS